MKNTTFGYKKNPEMLICKKTYEYNYMTWNSVQNTDLLIAPLPNFHMQREHKRLDHFSIAQAFI